MGEGEDHGIQECQVQSPVPGPAQSQDQYMPGDEGIENSPMEYDLGVLLGEKQGMRQQCTQLRKPAILWAVPK